MLDERTMRSIGMMLARQAREQAGREDAPANEVIDLSPLLAAWKEGAHTAGEVVAYVGMPYRCVQSHDSTGNPGWTPPAVPALFAPYHGTDAAHALPWQAPTGAQDAYQAGEWMIWTDGDVYRCVQDATVWGPDVLPAAWTKGA